MPDISMCCNEKCNRKKECYRYMARPSDFQVYSSFNEKDCNDFWPASDYPDYMIDLEKRDE